MAGIYIHIPFCKQKCSYCDFHFSVDTSYQERMITCLKNELFDRADEIQDQVIETVYFGGGTPSLLGNSQLESIVSTLKKNYHIESGAEVTMECNPDDVDKAKLELWLRSGINRLSLGIQSFDNRDLKSMNRAHDSEMARESIDLTKDAGFQNITVDMIYGLPERNRAEFEANVQEFIDLDVDHISAYALTIEPGTLYGTLYSKGQLRLPDDEDVAEQFIVLRDKLKEAGHEQYEVSNFARNGRISKHNTAYWRKKDYMGFGPSAHSFNGTSRRWNVSNNHRYMKAMESGEDYWDSEELSLKDRYNEYIMTMSRTKWGLDLDFVTQEFGVDVLSDHKELWESLQGKFKSDKGKLTFTPEGLLLIDRIASDLFMID